jgi:hypothetical protein
MIKTSSDRLPGPLRTFAPEAAVDRDRRARLIRGARELVRTDFQSCRGLMRPDGLIGFHAIAPEVQARFGAATSADVGGVPPALAGEIVEDPSQDDCRIESAAPGCGHW